MTYGSEHTPRNFKHPITAQKHGVIRCKTNSECVDLKMQQTIHESLLVAESVMAKMSSIYFNAETGREMETKSFRNQRNENTKCQALVKMWPILAELNTKRLINIGAWAWKIIFTLQSLTFNSPQATDPNICQGP